MRNDSRATLPVQGNRYADEHIRRVGFQSGRKWRARQESNLWPLPSEGSERRGGTGTGTACDWRFLGFVHPAAGSRASAASAAVPLGCH